MRENEGVCRVLILSIDFVSGRTFVTYRTMDSGETWSRDLASWHAGADLLPACPTCGGDGIVRDVVRGRGGRMHDTSRSCGSCGGCGYVKAGEPHST